MKKIREETPQESFVENPAVAESTTKPQRISLRVSEDGSIDWDSASQKTKDLFSSVVSQDPTALEMIGLAAGGAGAELPEGYVTPEQMRDFLNGYSWLVRYLAPVVVEKKSHGLIRCNKMVAEQTFRFSDNQLDMLAPNGAEWVNNSMPEWMRKFIFETVGPGAKFFGGLAFITYGQIQAYATACVKLNPPAGAENTMPSAVSPNGHDKSEEPQE